MDVNSDISNSGGPLPETNSSHLKILHPKRDFIFQPSIHQFSGASCWVSGNCKSSPLSSIKSCNLKIDGWKATWIKGAWILFFSCENVSFREGPSLSIPHDVYAKIMPFLRKGFLFRFFAFHLEGESPHKGIVVVKKMVTLVSQHTLDTPITYAGCCIIQILKTRIPC